MFVKASPDKINSLGKYHPVPIESTNQHECRTQSEVLQNKQKGNYFQKRQRCFIRIV